MADIVRIKGNIKKMVDAGAPEQDIDDYLATEGVSAESLQQPKDTTDLATDLVLGAGATAVAGAIKGIKIFKKPEAMLNARERTIGVIKENYLNEPFVSSQDVPSRIRQKGEQNVQKMRTDLIGKKGQVKSIQSSIEQSKRNLKTGLDNFDRTILSGSVEETASMLKEKTPEFFNKTYENYGSMLDGAENVLIKNGKQLSSDIFVTDVLDKTINDAIASGVPEEKLVKLRRFRDSVLGGSTSDITDASAKPFVIGKPVTVRQLKGNINYLGKDIPKDAAMILRGNWGSMLEKTSPEVAETIADANKDYTKFSKIRKALYKTVDLDTGDFNKDKLNRMLYAYTKSNVETGLKDTIDLMAKGQGIIAPVSGADAPFGRLVSAKKTRIGMQDAAVGQQTSLASQASGIEKSASDIAKKIEESKQKTMFWAGKAEKLLSEKEGIKEKHPIRSGGLGRAVSNMVGVGARAATANATRGVMRAVPFANAYMMIRDAVTSYSDPAKMVASQMGLEMPDKGTKERAALEYQASIMNGSPEEVAIAKKEIDRLKVDEYELGDILKSYGIVGGAI